MEASMKTNMEEFRKKVQDYGKRIDRSVETAATDLSFRAANAIKRDFTNFLNQGPSQAGGTTRTAHLRSTVHPVVKNQSQFGVATNSPYARVHELGIGPYTIRPKAVGLAPAGNLSPLSGSIGFAGVRRIGRRRRGLAGGVLRFEIGGDVVYAKSVRHPGQKARHWMSIPMREELTKYIDDQIDKLEKKPL